VDGATNLADCKQWGVLSLKQPLIKSFDLRTFRSTRRSGTFSPLCISWKISDSLRAARNHVPSRQWLRGGNHAFRISLKVWRATWMSKECWELGQVDYICPLFEELFRIGLALCTWNVFRRRLGIEIHIFVWETIQHWNPWIGLCLDRSSDFVCSIESHRLSTHAAAE
jgi:hypothetical protein